MTEKYERPEGVTEREWAEFVENIEEHEDALLRRICLDCGSSLTKKMDPKKENGGRGVWFNYCCVNSDCEFALDQFEAN